MQRFRNRIVPHRQDPDAPIVRKVPATSVPFGDSISAHGKHVWVAYAPDGTQVVVAATAEEARFKYRQIRRRKLTEPSE